MLAVISDYVGAIINVLSCVIYTKIILKKNIVINKTRFVFLVLGISLIIQILCYFNVTFLKTVLVIFLFSYLIKIIFNLGISRVYILSFFYFIILMFSDMSVIKILIFLFGEDKFYNIMAGSLLSNVVILIPLFLLTYILRKLILKCLNIKFQHQLIFMLIISLLCIVLVFFSTFKLGANSVDNLLGFLSLVVITIILVNTFIQVYKNNQLMIEYDNLLEFIKKYEIEIDNQRIIRHEAKNQLLTIKSKIIDNESNEDVIRYIDEVINDKKKVKHSEYARFKSLPSNGIKGLFYFKVSLAQDKKIKVSVNISDNLSQSRLGNLNSSLFNQIGKILGVYLDNAIEGAELSKKKIMGIEIYEENNRIIFIISNSYDSSIQKIGRSSKGIGRGYGLLLVGNIINANKNLSTETEITDNLYVKRLIIKE